MLYPTASNRQFGEALVRFTNKEQRDLALKRSGMKFGARSVEVCNLMFTASSIKFVLCEHKTKS